MNKNYILSGGEPILLIDLFKVIEHALGKKNTYISIPFPIAYLGAIFLNFLTLGKYDFRERVQRLVEPRVFSHQEAKDDFGYAPKVFAVGVEEEIEEYIKCTRNYK